MNPYESPSAAETQSTPAAPHGTSILKEAWRGAKFGAKLTACSLGAIMAMVCLVLTGLASVGWLSPIEHVGGAIELIKRIGMLILGIAVASAWGAIAGAIIMSLAAIVRRLRGTVNNQA